MNLLEQYIVEVHEEKPTTRKKWMEEPYVHVDITTTCYGRDERRTHMFPAAAWETHKARGYFMA